MTLKMIVTLLAFGMLAAMPLQAAHHKMPPEMVLPCKDKAEGDACQFSRENGDEIEGVCQAGHDTLFCHPQGKGREEAAQQLIAACADKSAGDQCVMSGRGGNEMTGQCMEHPSGKLMCHQEKVHKKGY
ncbi:hypothetical protein Fbal_1570 [Ferrimonas balearica DSM 9799]|uniref:Uncharacterized protein n=1 Tax=Ferrimonas balearica (strain DSM 9799 / CCM 4581 / KCTC 23876 / PAT) TaxID=550540 RepID=E1SPX9_FERBD|nr:hypothetical protein [Ferrimonas balearica]ADN75774.1 hypothetical protein Fbal_1570 [Ferrimonas balearica DSM 9799]